MERITIASQQAGFKLVDRITAINQKGISGETAFSRSALYLGLEAMAQIGALHVRHLIHFKRHAFLLAVKKFSFPSQKLLEGHFALTAAVTAQSRQAFFYHTTAQGPDVLPLKADLMFGTVPYNDQFQQDHLQRHYEQLFEELYESTTMTE